MIVLPCIIYFGFKFYIMHAIGIYEMSLFLGYHRTLKGYKLLQLEDVLFLSDILFKGCCHDTSVGILAYFVQICNMLSWFQVK